MNARRRKALDRLDDKVTDLEVIVDEWVRRESSQPPTPPPPSADPDDDDIGMPLVFVTPR